MIEKRLKAEICFAKQILAEQDTNSVFNFKVFVRITTYKKPKSAAF